MKNDRHSSERRDLKMLGRLLRELRQKRDITQKDVLTALGKSSESTKVLSRYEAGLRKPSRETLITILRDGIRETEPTVISRCLKIVGYEPLTSEELVRWGLSHIATLGEPEPQKVRWGPVDNKPAGMIIIGVHNAFIPWRDLKEEIEHKLLNQVRRLVPLGSKVRLKEFCGQKEWVVEIVGANSKSIGHVWFGPDPENKWAFDGMVRLGDSSVWQIFQRFSDGSYRRIRANVE